MDYRILYCLPFFLSATLIFIVAIFAFRRVKARGGWHLIFVCLASTIWAVTEGILYFGLDIEANMLITKLQYFGIVSLPPLALLFCLSVFGFESWVNRITYLLLFLIAATIVLIVWTNPLHKLFFTEYYTIQSEQFPMLGLKHGPLWWIVIFYHYSIIAVLSIILLRQMMTYSGFYRFQAAVILVAVAFVWVINAVYVSGNSPVPNMDISPIAFIMVAGAMAWGFFRHGLLDISPVAKAEIFRGLDDII